MITAANDEFFLPTDTRYWWEEMPQHEELNRLLILPNSCHSCGEELFARQSTLSSWVGLLLADRQLPSLRWSQDPVTGDITLTSDRDPVVVEVWSAPSCSQERRDWRVANLDNPCTCGTSDSGVCFNEVSIWTSEPLQETSKGYSTMLDYHPQLVDVPGSRTWVAHRDPPEDGRFLAFYVSVQYNVDEELGRDGGTMEFSTTVSVVPDVFPYPECYAEECLGSLL